MVKLEAKERVVSMRALQARVEGLDSLQGTGRPVESGWRAASLQASAAVCVAQWGRAVESKGCRYIQNLPKDCTYRLKDREELR